MKTRTTHVKKFMMATMATAALISAAWAARDDIAVTRFQMRSLANDSTVLIQGTLSCEMAEVNTGEACKLTLTEEGSGKKYSVVGNSAAMQAFQNGKRAVTIRGEITEENVIAATQVFNR